jgi:hypothetical protein
MKRLGCVAMLASAAALLAMPGNAGAAVTIGSDLSKPVGFGGGGDPVVGISVAIPGRVTQAPFDGVVTRWRIKKGITNWGTVHLRVIRAVATDTYVGAGTSEPQAPGTVAGDFLFPTRLPIAVGDFIGVNATSQWQGAPNQPGVVTHLVTSPPDGGPPSGSPIVQDEEIFVNADVEPDCDRDGFGDETQDPMIAQVLTCDPLPPNGTINKGPKKLVKTEKPKARVKFNFSSTETGSTFQCKLDRKPYKACSSPRRYRIKATEEPKKHVFLLRTTDIAGNVDPTPAKRSFRVERVD